MSSRHSTAFAVLSALLAVVPAGPARAQMAKPGEVSTALSISGLYQFDTDLDQGGDFNWSGVQASKSSPRVTKVTP